MRWTHWMRGAGTAVTGSGFCQDTKPYTVYTITCFDRPFSTSGTWKGDTVTEGSKASSAAAERNGAFVRFDTSNPARYIRSARTDGAAYGKTCLTTDDIRGTRDLSFEVGAEPSRWGTSADAAPPALK